ncbi:MAG: ribosomal RNA small subunit methyltransferase I [Micavibrio sp.]|nr:MAG: ribosomal RNA small subunit methyltransferase I [Micavibrio sp.]
MTKHPTKKEGGWLQPVSLEPGLYIVATPIGNLRDITLRALDVLNGADIIACEDTRVSGKLLKAYDIGNKLLSYNDHNASKQRGKILEKLASGESVALISDAGMPLVSDPGYKLVRDCLDLGLNVTSIPGANAPLTALQLSGLPTDRFCFLGFLPPKEKARREALEAWRSTKATLVMFETAPRLTDVLVDIEAVLGDREMAVLRELTKMYEEVRRGRVSGLVTHYQENGQPKGELVLVIAPPEEEVFSEKDLMEKLTEALKTMGTKEAASHVADETGASRKVLYEIALKIPKQ